MSAAASALAGSTLTRAGEILSDLSPLFAILLGVALAGYVGFVVLGWVRS